MTALVNVFPCFTVNNRKNYLLTNTVLRSQADASCISLGVYAAYSAYVLFRKFGSWVIGAPETTRIICDIAFSRLRRLFYAFRTMRCVPGSATQSAFWFCMSSVFNITYQITVVTVTCFSILCVIFVCTLYEMMGVYALRVVACMTNNKFCISSISDIKRQPVRAVYAKLALYIKSHGPIVFGCSGAFPQPTSLFRFLDFYFFPKTFYSNRINSDDSDRFYHTPFIHPKDRKVKDV